MGNAKNSLCMLAVAGLAIVVATTAQAEPARVTANVNMRAAPGSSYAVIDIVPRKSIVNARYCIGNGWCRVEWRGNRGWIDKNYLRVRHLKRRG